MGARQGLAQAMMVAGMKVEAERELAMVAQGQPGNFTVWALLGQVRVEVGDHAGAAEAWKVALSLYPANAPGERRATLIANIGAALSDAGKLAEALPYLKQGAALAPGHQGRQLNYAKALSAAGMIEEAEGVLRAAVGLAQSSRAHQDLAAALGEQGYIDEAMEHQRRAMALDPGDARHHSNLLLSMRYSDRLSPEEVVGEHRAFGARFAEVARPVRGGGGGVEKIRVGYLSADLCRHPVASFIEGIFRHHDRQRFEVHAFACGERADEVTARLKGLVDGWTAIGKSVSDDAAAEMIRSKEIDVLIDLGGHTSGNRLPILARRPAAVQGMYMGYPGTTGMSQVDFFLTDSTVDPAGAERFYTEKLCRVDEGTTVGRHRPFLAFMPDAEAVAVSELPAGRNGYVTFGALGNLAKVTPTTLAMWAGVLREVKGSKLIVRARAAAVKGAQRRVLEAMEREGVAVDRVKFLSWAPGGSRWELYSQIDLGLDAFPYHGTTTTCEAMWMGVPTVCRVGEMHAGRVGLTLLKSVGLEELAAQTSEGFVQVAAKLAGDVGKMREIRASLRERMRGSGLMDAQELTRRIEAKLLEMLRL